MELHVQVKWIAPRMLQTRIAPLPVPPDDEESFCSHKTVRVPEECAIYIPTFSLLNTYWMGVLEAYFSASIMPPVTGDIRCGSPPLNIDLRGKGLPQTLAYHLLHSPLVQPLLEQLHYLAKSARDEIMEHKPDESSP